MENKRLYQVIDPIGRHSASRIMLLGCHHDLPAGRKDLLGLVRAMLNVTRPTGPIVYLRGREPAPPVR